MARWRLAAAHYLNLVDPAIWEYKEVDRKTGRPKTRKFEVPTLLNPEDPADWNIVHERNQFGVAEAGEIVVCYAGKGGDPRDIEFVGDPTPDMVPLDDEAKEISAKFAERWSHPIESLSGTYGEALLDDLQAEAARVRAEQNKPAQVEGMTELLTALSQMMQQNQEILATLAKSAPQAQIRRQ